MILKPLPKDLCNKFDSDSLIYCSDDSFYYGDSVDKNLIKDITNHTLQLYNGYYHFKTGWDSPKLYYTGRGLNSGKVKVKIQNFHPYFYDEQEVSSHKTYLGKPVEKMVLLGQHPRNVKRYREYCAKMGFSMPYETDIRFPVRFLIDTYDYFKPKEAIKPKVCILDIETDHPVSNDLISFAINNQEDSLYYRSKYDDMYPSELALDILHQLQKYDVVTGWNIEFDIDNLYLPIKKNPQVLNKIDRHIDYARSHKEFTKEKYIENMSKGNRYFSDEETERLINVLIDYDYLREDTDGVIVLGDRDFNPKITEHIAVIDMMFLSKKMHAREIRGRWSLDNTGIQICGMGKVHIGATRIGDLEPEELMEYNCVDTIIPEVIDNVLGGIEAHTILAWSLQSLIEKRSFITAVINDIALLREYHRKGIVLPTRGFDSKDNSKESKYDAAEPDARPGVYEGLITLDLKHAYPSAVISKNISCETKDVNGNNIVEFTSKNNEHKVIKFNNKHSVFIDTLKELMKERGKVKEQLKSIRKASDEYKRLKSIDFALKTQSAAFSHGIFGWSNSRMVDYEVADAITAVVRDIINLIKDACDAIDLVWCYCHTDSIFVNAPSEQQEAVAGYLNDIIGDYFANEEVIPDLELKGFYPKSYIHSPARNVLVDENGEWHVTGMNFYRSETPAPLGNIEQELIKMKMNKCNIDDMTIKLKSMILALPNEDTGELGIYKPLNKPISEYGRTLDDGTHGAVPYHIKAYLRANKEYGFNVSVGEKFALIPILTDELVGKRKIRRKRVDIAYSIEDGLPSQYQIDWEYYLQSALFGKICGLFDMTSKELENKVMTNNVKRCLNVPKIEKE